MTACWLLLTKILYERQRKHTPASVLSRVVVEKEEEVMLREGG